MELIFRLPATFSIIASTSVILGAWLSILLQVLILERFGPMTIILFSDHDCTSLLSGKYSATRSEWWLVIGTWDVILLHLLLCFLYCRMGPSVCRIQCVIYMWMEKVFQTLFKIMVLKEALRAKEANPYLKYTLLEESLPFCTLNSGQFATKMPD